MNEIELYNSDCITVMNQLIVNSVKVNVIIMDRYKDE